MTTVTMVAPNGGGTLQGAAASYNIASDGTVTVPVSMVSQLLDAGFKFFRTALMQATFIAPFAADLVSIKAAATPVDGTITIVKQPDYPRKLAVRIVIGTPATTDITAGTLTLVGKDQNGNSITEVISLVAAASATIKTTNAFASLTSGTVAAYAADGSGTGNTLGIGVAADLGLPVPSNFIGLDIVKATKVVHTNTGSPTDVTAVAAVAADDVAATCTVDETVGTVASTTAPGSTATTTTDFIFNYSYGLPD